MPCSLDPAPMLLVSIRRPQLERLAALSLERPEFMSVDAPAAAPGAAPRGADGARAGTGGMPQPAVARDARTSTLTRPVPAGGTRRLRHAASARTALRRVRGQAPARGPVRLSAETDCAAVSVRQGCGGVLRAPSAYPSSLQQDDQVCGVLLHLRRGRLPPPSAARRPVGHGLEGSSGGHALPARRQ